jgi:hypothetical protein
MPLLPRLHVLAACLLLAGLASLVAAPLPELDRKHAQAVWEEVRLPPLRAEKQIPPKFDERFAPDWAKEYAADQRDTPLRQAVRRTRALLWAVALDGTGCPADLAREVAKLREERPVDLSVLKDGLPVLAPNAPPPNEREFRGRILMQQHNVARVLARLEEAREELAKAASERARESRRWQAHHDYVAAYLQLQLAFLYEYQSALGALRKELPPHDPKMHTRWVLSPRPALAGDYEGKKHARDAARRLDQILRERAGTPWEVLARRAKELPLGLEWKAQR